MVQQIKDLALGQLWHRLQLQLGFHPWPWELLYAEGEAKKKESGHVKMVND